jgi:hypothetical protein
MLKKIFLKKTLKTLKEHGLECGSRSPTPKKHGLE